MSGSDIALGVRVPQPPDMLQSALRIGALQNYANQNKLFGAHQAVGEAMRASIGEDGEPDHNKLLGILRNDPRVDPAMLETVGTALAQRTQAQGFSDNQRVAIGRGMGGVMADPDQKPEKYAATLDDLEKSRVVTKPQADIARARLAQAGSDPVKLRQFATSFLIGTMASPNIAQQVFPQVFDRERGGVVEQGTRQPPLLGGAANPPASSYTTGLSPAEATGQVTVPVLDENGQPTGQTETISRQEYANRRGLGLPGYGADPGPSNPLLGGLQGADVAGRPNVAGRNGIPPGAPIRPLIPGVPPDAAPPAAAPAAPPAAAPAARPGVPRDASLPPGEAERRQADITAYTAAQQAVPTQQRAVQTLQTARQALDIAATGPGTENLQRALAFLKVVHVPIGSDQATNWAVAHKALLDYARQAGAAASSNEQLRAALGSNASTDIDPTAAMHVVQQEIGRQRQNIAAYTDHGDKTGIGFGKAAADFASNTDPRAFAIDAYSKPELKAMLERMGPAERAKFEYSLGLAYKHKLITLPGR